MAEDNPAPQPMLVVDASTPTIHVGVLSGARWLSLRRREGEALETLFSLAADAMDVAAMPVAALGGFITCEGPGGLLGLRLGAMAVQTWRAIPRQATKPLLRYRSLRIAQALASRALGEPVTIVSPFRRGSFCILRAGTVEITVADASEVSAAASAERTLFVAQRFQREPPPGAELWDYDLQELPGLLQQQPELFERADAATVWVPEETEYKLWSGERHR